MKNWILLRVGVGLFILALLDVETGVQTIDQLLEAVPIEWLQELIGV